jgi:hypothetical protein
MASDIEEYSGYSIYWETRSCSLPDADLWKAKVGIVSPPDTFGATNTTILGISREKFKSEEEARNYAIRAANQWIEGRLSVRQKVARRKQLLYGEKHSPKQIR